MRQIVIDTETTGLDPKQGHRIIELAAVEMVSRRVTGEVRHWYLNPERDIGEDATKIHGMRWDDLKDKPRFTDIADEFIGFCHDAEWIIHNAAFDLEFLDAELARARKPLCETFYGGVMDTLMEARRQFPGKLNSLDALCSRFGISNAHRTLHGACLDAQLLADVYLALTRGQESLVIAAPPGHDVQILRTIPHNIKVLEASPEERAAHEAYLDELRKKGACLWASSF
ncbi:MAG: DNA polymerase III subunit epsilon [Burkholderiales bacterium]|jgi:DNA polymerase-3 subunit epsilon|nr:DNA polymerase III subunit epsilon [Burkholderiales bacterium]